MSILSQILQRIGGQNLSEDKHNSLLDAAIGLIDNPETGGLAGLLNRFKSEGLGGVISSWISSGPNQPIQPGQVEQVVGPDRLQQIANKLGITPEETSQALAKLLPEVVDKMTPQGNIPAADSQGVAPGDVKKLFNG